MEPRPCTATGSAPPEAYPFPSTSPTSSRLPTLTEKRPCTWERASTISFDLEVEKEGCGRSIADTCSEATEQAASSLNRGFRAEQKIQGPAERWGERPRALRIRQREADEDRVDGPPRQSGDRPGDTR